METAADIQRARQEMIAGQLRRRGIRSESVLAAMDRVPRERFLPPELAAEAYADRAVAIACEQTISQPYIVALMTEALAVRPSDRVLEIGTGSGYQTAVLAQLAGEVITIERHVPLSKSAAATLAELGYTNVQLLIGDGTLGYPAAAPFSRVLVTAGARACRARCESNWPTGASWSCPSASMIVSYSRSCARSVGNFSSGFFPRAASSP